MDVVQILSEIFREIGGKHFFLRIVLKIVDQNSADQYRLGIFNDAESDGYRARGDKNGSHNPEFIIFPDIRKFFLPG